MIPVNEPVSLEIEARFVCVDCNVNTLYINEYYVIHDHLWETYGVDDKMLCVGCLETRIGRQLVADDFKEAPINIINKYMSERLCSRLSAK